MMEHQLITAQIRVNVVDLDEILQQPVAEILSQPVREFGCRLWPKVLQQPVGVSVQS